MDFSPVFQIWIFIFRFGLFFSFSDLDSLFFSDLDFIFYFQVWTIFIFQIWIFLLIFRFGFSFPISGLDSLYISDLIFLNSISELGSLFLFHFQIWILFIFQIWIFFFIFRFGSSFFPFMIFFFNNLKTYFRYVPADF